MTTGEPHERDRAPPARAVSAADIRRLLAGPGGLVVERWKAFRRNVAGAAAATAHPPVWLGFLFGFALLCAGLLIGPRVPDSDAGSLCVGNIGLPGPFGISLNCDSPEFMWLARDPSGLLFHENSRQSRPGMILLAALIQAPLSLIAPADGPPTAAYQGLFDPDTIVRSFVRDRPAYFAYLLLNFAILLATFGVLRAVIDRHGKASDTASATILVATGLLIVANDVTKAFLWSPHTQLLNVLAPVLAVYATQRALGAPLARRFALGMGAAVGIGITAYPVFAVIPACVLPPAIVAALRERSSAARCRALANLAVFCALAVIPAALWYLVVRVEVGHFSSAELDMGELVWMKDALGKGLDPFLAQWFGYARQLIEFAAPQAIALGALVAWLAVAVVAMAQRREIKPARLSAALPILATGLYVGVALLGFYTCVGWIVDRLAYPMIPPLLAAAGAAAVVIAQHLPPARRPVLAVGCLVIAIAQMIYVVAKDGPWS
jgi:hypothetical protein